MFLDNISNKVTIDDLFVRLVKTVTEKVLQEVIQTLKKNSQQDGYSPPNLISPAEIRLLTSPPIARTTLYNWTKKGKIKAYKVGKRVLYSKEEVMKFLTSVVKKPP